MLYCNTAIVAATRRASSRRWGALGAQQAQPWALRRAWASGRAQQAAGRAGVGRSGARGVQAGTRAGVGAAGRGRARGAARQGARARRQLGYRRARGRAQQAWARGALGVGAWGAGRGRTGSVAWALGGRPGCLGWPGLCTWCTRPFLALVDSVFS